MGCERGNHIQSRVRSGTLSGPLLSVAFAAGLLLGPQDASAGISRLGTAPAATARTTNAQLQTVTGGDSVSHAAVSNADSSRLRREARDAQRAFERTRVRHLPLTWAGGGWDCDEIVGRMCWRHDDEDDDWEPEPEAVQILVARDTLLLRLGRIGDRIPGDDWVLAQRIWYLGEADRWGEAAALADHCPGEHDSWCSALAGLALHQLGEYEAAAEAFAAGLPALSERRSDREALELLLTGEARRWIEEDGEPGKLEAADGSAPTDGGTRTVPSPEAASTHRERLLWALADPLWGVPGNDRLTAHHARRTLDLIRRGAVNPYGLPWGDDTAELLIRYGWEAGWERDQSRSMVETSARVVGRNPSRGRRFMPSAEVLRSPATADTAELAPFRTRPRSSYAPPYVREVVPATGQVLSVGRKDDGYVVWAVLDEPPEPALDATPQVSESRTEGAKTGGFALDLQTLGILPADSLAPGVYGLEVPYGGHVLSVEDWSRGERPTVRRLRRGILTERLPPDVVSVSDLLLLENGPLPERVEDAPARLLRRAPAPRDTVVVAWIVNGLGFDGAELQYSLTTAEEAGGALRRLGRFFKIIEPEASVFTRWTEPAPPDPGPLFRAVRLVLPDWEPGAHVLTLSLRTGGRATVVSRSALVLR